MQEGIWSSLVYGARLENEYFKKVVSSNLTVPEVASTKFRRSRRNNPLHLPVHQLRAELGRGGLASGPRQPSTGIPSFGWDEGRSAQGATLNHGCRSREGGMRKVVDSGVDFT